MTQFPPTIQTDALRDLPQQSQLKVLSILWYVDAGLYLLGICGGGLYLFFGIMAFSNEDMFEPRNPGDPSPETFAWIFTTAGAVMITLSLVMGILALVTASNLSKRRGFTFCVVVGSITCLFFPLGTALGVFTLITLFAKGVKESFTATQS